MRTPRLYTQFNNKIDYMKRLKRTYEEHQFHRKSLGREYKELVLKDWKQRAISIDTLNQNLAELETFEKDVIEGKILINENEMQNFQELD